jgi:hypothetical protein
LKANVGSLGKSHDRLRTRVEVLDHKVDDVAAGVAQVKESNGHIEAMVKDLHNGQSGPRKARAVGLGGLGAILVAVGEWVRQHWPIGG